MKKNLYMKTFVIGVIFLFFGVGAVPNISGNTRNMDNVNDVNNFEYKDENLTVIFFLLGEVSNYTIEDGIKFTADNVFFLGMSFDDPLPIRVRGMMLDNDEEVLVTHKYMGRITEEFIFGLFNVAYPDPFM